MVDASVATKGVEMATDKQGEYTKTTVPKLNAARRQLDTAIEMWFTDKDVVSTHTLAAAAHQIIYDINKRERAGDLLFDSIVVREEYRKEFIDRLKRDMNFFKHADKDPDAVIEFVPITTVLYIIYSLAGLSKLGKNNNDIEQLFMLWLAIHHPSWFQTDYRTKLEKQLKSGILTDIREWEKREFFNVGLQSMASARG
jgi:hypothetical protein